MLEAGDVVVFNNKKGGWYSAAQRFFTRMPYTHVGVIIGNLNGQLALLEAKEVVAVTPWSNFVGNPNLLYYVFRPTRALVSEQALIDLWRRYAGRPYGYFQILWFVYRWIAESWPFHADVRAQKNPFPTGDICSEVGYNWIAWLSLQRPDLEAKILEWNENTVHAGDIFTICTAVKGEFTMVETNHV